MPWIRYKFRSSVSFETVEIVNGRTYISLSELRARILHGKNSQQGFDLVFSDADTGSELKGDDYQIPSGSSVIVKRVPASTAPSVLPAITAAKEFGAKDSIALKPCVAQKVKLDNFGKDSMPDMELPQFDVEIAANNIIDNEMEVIPGLRLEHPKHGLGNMNQERARDCNQQANEKKLVKEARAAEIKLPTSNVPAVQNSNLPLELKCSLCQTFFKEAVMIPCCQHSFCDPCIRLVLTENGRCPKCFSSACSVENLLPNLSLRQAIKHFLDSQMHEVELDKAMDNFAPDGESGIEAREISCATETGSNMGSYRRRNFVLGGPGDRGLKSAFPSQMLKQSIGSGGHPQHGGLQRGYANCAPPEDFQGESQPFVVPTADLHGGGAHSSFFVHGGQRKGVRTCYTCGSPEHLMRDCPASNSYPMFHPGNGAFNGGMGNYTPYWNGSSMPPFGPYANMYGNPGSAMMSYNPSFPVTPYGVPPYMPSMYGGMPDQSGNMKPPQNPDHFGLQHSSDNGRKHSNENMSREQFSDNGDGSPETYHHSYPEKSRDYKSQKRKESSLSHSGNSSQRSGRRSHHDKHMDSDRHYVDERHEKGSHSSARRDKKPHAERSNSGKEEITRSHGRHTEGRYKHHDHSDYESRHPRQSEKHSRDQRHDDRREAARGSNEDMREDHDRRKHDHHHKRKRIY